MDFYALRPLAFAIIELGLAWYVWRKGKLYPRLLALILLFLGGYQVGEFIFIGLQSDIGLRVSLFSTTLLPPLGILLVQKINKIQLGYVIFQAIAIVLAVLLLLNPDIYSGARDTYCLVKYTVLANDNANILVSIWGVYYGAGLLIGMLFSGFFALTKLKNKMLNILVLLAYASFFPTSYLIVVLFEGDSSVLASFMCALAIFAAPIIAYASLRGKAR